MTRIGAAIREAGRHPVTTAAKIAGRLFPQLPWRNHVRQARRAGFTRPYFILSFDCDTNRDLGVVEDVHARLGMRCILPVYAVPGELLERGSAVYRRIADTGAEFINHGYVQHTHYYAESNTYVSSYFYDQLSAAQIEEDVVRGHEAVVAVLGRAPTGFRTPHFGTYQTSKQLRFLYRLLEKLGYRYSTSAVPIRSLISGPVQRVTPSLFEIPVSGGYKWPTALIDSYGFRYAPNRMVNTADYVREMSSVMGFFEGPGRGGLLNYYADPSQVFDWPEFFDVMAMAAPIAANSYSAVLDAVRA